uniref:Uncharacterized protein n=1 Tax=Arundo donax TaxID=35708 RepID=A0A0A9GZ14_ARUDO
MLCAAEHQIVKSSQVGHCRISFNGNDNFVTGQSCCIASCCYCHSKATPMYVSGVI